MCTSHWFSCLFTPGIREKEKIFTSLGVLGSIIIRKHTFIVVILTGKVVEHRIVLSIDKLIMRETRSKSKFLALLTGLEPLSRRSMSESHLLAFAFILASSNVIDSLWRELTISICVLSANNIDNFDYSLAILGKLIVGETSHLTFDHLFASPNILFRERYTCRSESTRIVLGFLLIVAILMVDKWLRLSDIHLTREGWVVISEKGVFLRITVLTYMLFAMPLHLSYWHVVNILSLHVDWLARITSGFFQIAASVNEFIISCLTLIDVLDLLLLQRIRL